MSRVYFIRPVGLRGPIKIGCSVSPDGRRKTLENWSPFALEIVATIEGSTRLERRFHALFADQHEKHEWFAWSRRLESVIAQINAGEFDVETLPEPMRLVGDLEEIRAKHLATWTPKRRLEASYSARVRHAQIKSRTISPYYASQVHDPKVREALDAYLADPAKHGESVEAYHKRTGFMPWWARKSAEREPAKAA